MRGWRRLLAVLSCLAAGCTFGVHYDDLFDGPKSDPDGGPDAETGGTTDSSAPNDADAPLSSSDASDAGSGEGGTAPVACDPFVLTLGEAGGPGPCAYGEICSQSTSTCTRAPSCAFWDPSGRGPVIVDVKVLTAPHDEALCPRTDSGYYPTFGPWGVYFQVTYYAPSGLSLASYSEINERVRVRTSADLSENVPWYHIGTYAGGSGTSGTFTFGACSANVSDSATIYMSTPSGAIGNRACIKY